MLEPEIQKKLWLLSQKRKANPPYLLPFPEWGKKVDPSLVFPFQPKSILLELGSGWGEVGVQLAIQNPQVGYLLVERNPDRIRATIREAKKQELKNLRILPFNFHWFFEEVFTFSSVDHVLLNFPDPWPKRKHHKNRTVRPEFLFALTQILKPEGRFSFATDHGGYARRTIQLFRKNANFFRDKQEEFLMTRPEFPVSVFEGEKIAEGKKITYLEKVRTSFYPKSSSDLFL